MGGIQVSHQYAGDNPIMMNDPDGAKATPAAIWQLMQNSMAAEAACQNMGGNMHLAGIGWEDGPAFGGPMPALNEGTYGDGGVGLYYSNPKAYWNYYYLNMQCLRKNCWLNIIPKKAYW